MKRLFVTLMLALSLISAANGQTVITIGDTNVESAGDNGNGNLLLAQSAILSQSATIESLSFYVTNASGSLLLGVYDATGPGGGPGNLLTSAASFVPTTGWNTRNVTPVSVPAGMYWLAYLPSSGNLSFRKQNSSGSCFLKGQSFSTGLPSIFPASPSSCTPTTWSFYATLVTSSSSTTHYSLQYTLSGLDLRKYPLFSISTTDASGNVILTPVYMATEVFTTWLGQFPTLAACQAYVPPVNPSFTFSYLDPISGMQMDVTFVSGNNMTATNNGCGLHTFQ